MDELKKEYNQYLLRFIKAEVFMDNPMIPSDMKEKHIPELQKILQNLNVLLEEILRLGEIVTEKQLRGGFRI